MADKVIAVSRIKHDGDVVEPGAEVQGLSKEALDSLVQVGAVEIQKAAKAPVAKKTAIKKD